MATITLDATGLRCPQPVLKLALKVPEMNPGDLLEITADCPTFESDIKTWCERMRKTLLSVSQKGVTKTALVQF